MRIQKPFRMISLRKIRQQLAWIDTFLSERGGGIYEVFIKSPLSFNLIYLPHETESGGISFDPAPGDGEVLPDLDDRTVNSRFPLPGNSAQTAANCRIITPKEFMQTIYYAKTVE